MGDESALPNGGCDDRDLHRFEQHAQAARLWLAAGRLVLKRMAEEVCRTLWSTPAAFELLLQAG